MTAGTALEGLRRQRTEWAPWLAVVEAILREAEARAWDAAVPARRAAADAMAPLLTGAELSVDRSSVRSLLERLIRVAARGGTSKMETLGAVSTGDLDVLALFTASLCQKSARVREIADACGADAEAFQAVAALLPVPFLQACNRRWASSISRGWIRGYCPVCASWPVIAEVRGIERSRYFRCGRCGGEWHAHILHCPYCGTRDHDELATLVPEKSGSPAVIEACKRCRGYVKAFTTLQGCPPGAVMLEDLGSVALDVAALEQGYARPAGAGASLDVTVIDRPATRRFFAWKS